MESKKPPGLAVSSALPLSQVGRTEPIQPIAAEHRYFVGKFSGSFLSIADAVANALSDAGLPPETTAMGELSALPGSSKILAFQTPPGTTAAENDLLIFIVEPVADGTVNLWLSGTDMARERRDEAEDDVVNFCEMLGDGFFKTFERL